MVIHRVVHMGGEGWLGLESRIVGELSTGCGLPCGYQSPPLGGPHDSYPLVPCGRLCCARHPLDPGSAGDRPCRRGGGRDLPDRLGPGLGDPVGSTAAYQMGEGSRPAPWVSSPLRGSERLARWGLRHAGVGAPFFVPANRNVLVLFCSGSVERVDSAVGDVFVEGAGLQGGAPRAVPFFDLSYRTVQPERTCPTYTRTPVG